MKASRLTVEHTIHVVILLLGFGVRILNLDGAPLTDPEALGALRALELFRGGGIEDSVQPGYVLGTGLLFFLFGDGVALARLLPALAGGGLVVVPYLLRGPLGRKTAVVLALGLALDPGLLALSRQASGLMMALGLGALALAFWIRGRAVTAGVFAGLALLSGPAALAGGLALLLAWVLLSLLRSTTGEVRQHVLRETGPPARAWRAGLLAGGGTLLLAGTLFLLIPEGLGMLANAIPAYFRGWVTLQGEPATRLLAALALYHPVPVLFGVLAIGRAWRGAGNPLGRSLSLWALVALALALLYPSRQVTDLAWALLPLWALAGMEISRSLNWLGGEAGWTSLGQAGLTLVFLAYVWLNLTGLARFPGDERASLLRWELIGGALLLIALTTILIARGWSMQVGRDGLVWGLCVSLGLYSLAASWGTVAGLEERVQEWWYPDAAPAEQGYLLETIRDVSEWHTGRRDAAEILVTLESPSLRWLLRDFPNARFDPAVSVDSLPVLVLTAGQNEPRLAASYRGTDFVWQRVRSWEGALPPEPVRWLVFREAPTQPVPVLLWARDDVFFDRVTGERETQGRPVGPPPFASN